jgi:hypothetical protein
MVHPPRYKPLRASFAPIAEMIAERPNPVNDGTGNKQVPKGAIGR